MSLRMLSMRIRERPPPDVADKPLLLARAGELGSRTPLGLGLDPLVYALRPAQWESKAGTMHLRGCGDLASAGASACQTIAELLAS